MEKRKKKAKREYKIKKGKNENEKARKNRKKKHKIKPEMCQLGWPKCTHRGEGARYVAIWQPTR